MTATQPADSTREPGSRPSYPQPNSRGEGTPWLAAIFAVIVPVLPTTSVFPGPLRGNGSPARILSFLFFTLIVLGFLVRRRTSDHPGVNPGTVIVIVFFVMQLATYATGLFEVGSPVVEASKDRTALSLVAQVGITLYILQTVRTARQRAIVLGCLITGIAYSCVIGILQGFFGIDLRFLAVPPGFVEVLETPELTSRQGALRVLGTSQHAIEFSVMAAASVPLSLHLARHATTPLRRQLAAIAGLLAVAAVPTAVSRSGVVTLAVALAVYMFAWKVRPIGNAILVGVGVLAAYAVVSPLYLKALWTTIVSSQSDKSITTRTEDYAAVGEQFRQDPWFGLGLGGYPPTEFRYLDNQWLQAVVQGGIVGLAALALLTLGSVAGMTAALRRSTTARDRNLAYALGAALIGIAVSSATFDLFSFQQITFVYFILYGLVWSFHSTPTTPDHRKAVTQEHPPPV